MVTAVLWACHILLLEHGKLDSGQTLKRAECEIQSCWGCVLGGWNGAVSCCSFILSLAHSFIHSGWNFRGPSVLSFKVLLQPPNLAHRSQLTFPCPFPGQHDLHLPTALFPCCLLGSSSPLGCQPCQGREVGNVLAAVASSI